MTNSADDTSADERARSVSKDENSMDEISIDEPGSGSNSRQTSAKRWKIRYRGATDAGTARLVNEDSFRIIRGRFWKLFLVADGIGGPTKGGVASELALETIEKELVEEATLSRELLSKALARANTKVFERGVSSPLLKGMATTISGFALQDDIIFLVNIGNSRVYRVRDNNIKQLTTDHTLAAELQALGSYDESVEKTRKASHLLTRSLGSAPTVEVNIERFSEGIRREDVFLVSSDGLTDLVRGPDLVKNLSGDWSDEIAQNLVDLANQRGGTDNITAIVIRFDRELSPSQAELGDEVGSRREVKSDEASAEEEEKVATRKEARPTGAFRLGGSDRHGRARSKTFSGIPAQVEEAVDGERERLLKDQETSATKSTQPPVGKGTDKDANHATSQESAITAPLDEEAKRIEQLIREAFGLGPASSTSSIAEKRGEQNGGDTKGAEPANQPQSQSFKGGGREERQAKGAATKEDRAKEGDYNEKETVTSGSKGGETVGVRATTAESREDDRSRGASGRRSAAEAEEDEEGEVEFAETEDLLDEDEDGYSDQEDGYLDEDDEEWYEDEQEEEYIPPAPSLPSRFAMWLVVGFFLGAGIALLYPYIGGESGSDSKVRLARKEVSEAGVRPGDEVRAGDQETRGISEQRRVAVGPSGQEEPDRDVDVAHEIRPLEDSERLPRKRGPGAEAEISAQYATMPQPQLVPMEKVAGVANPVLRLMISDVLNAIRSTLGDTSRRLDVVADRQETINDKIDELASELRVIESKLYKLQADSPELSRSEKRGEEIAE